MVPTIHHRNGTFIDKISDEAGSYKKCEQIEELVNLRTKQISVNANDATRIKTKLAIVYATYRCVIQTNLSMNNKHKSLLQVFSIHRNTCVRLHGTQQLCLFTTLNVGTPPVAHHPTRQKLIIARVQLVLAEPAVMRKTMEGLGIFEDDRPPSMCVLELISMFQIVRRKAARTSHTVMLHLQAARADLVDS